MGSTVVWTLLGFGLHPFVISPIRSPRDLCASPLTYKAENRFCSAAAESNERCMNAAVRATDIMSRRLCGLGSNHVAYPVS